MNVYEAFVGDRQVYQGVSYQRVMQIFSEITKDCSKKCIYCDSREFNLEAATTIDEYRISLKCPDAEFKCIKEHFEDDYIDDDGQYGITLFNRYKCTGVPNTHERVLIKCTDTDTGKVTEIGG